MVDDRFRVEVIGHATLRVQYGGRTLLTDPWLVGPIGCGTTFHFPPLVHDPAKLVAETDAIYVSHVHRDHFNPSTLDLFPRSTPIYIGEYRRKRFRDELRELGFTVVEVPFQHPTRIAGTELELSIVEHDYQETAAFDSAAVIRTPEFTVFENNDCFLHADKYRWVRANFAVDYAFLGYSPGSFYPIAFELDAAKKAALLEESAERRYRDFLEAAQLIGARLSMPFASGARFVTDDTLWKNVAFNSAAEAIRRLRAAGLNGAVMGPGDRIEIDGALTRVSPTYETRDELAAISEYARARRHWIASFAQPPPAVRDDLIDRFRDYILGLWRRSKQALPGMRRSVIAYVVRGPREQIFYFDFSRPDDEIFQWGEPAHYDMRYTYPAGGLQRRLDGQTDWDELHFTEAVSIHQINYAREFYMMLRSETLDLG